MIDYDAVINEFIRVARNGVGQFLSQTGPPNNPFPSVIRARGSNNQGIPAPPQPNVPYIVIDVLDTTDEASWLLDESCMDEEGNTIYTSVKMLLLNYRCYGGNSNNIMNRLHSYFKISRVRDEIRKNTGGSVVELTNIDPEPIILDKARFLETASFNIYFNIKDSITDSETGYFDSIVLDGELHRHIDDPNPLPLNIKAP